MNSFVQSSITSFSVLRTREERVVVLMYHGSTQVLVLLGSMSFVDLRFVTQQVLWSTNTVRCRIFFQFGSSTARLHPTLSLQAHALVIAIP
jgi:hypothetical protein